MSQPTTRTRDMAYFMTIGAQGARVFDDLKVGDTTGAIIDLFIGVVFLGLIWVIANLTIKRRTTDDAS